jgi:hypothetical protein
MRCLRGRSSYGSRPTGAATGATLFFEAEAYIERVRTERVDGAATGAATEVATGAEARATVAREATAGELRKVFLALSIERVCTIFLMYL